MKSSIAKVALVVFPLLAFSSTGFASQERIAAVTTQGVEAGAHAHKHKKAEQGRDKNEVSKSSYIAGSDDESIGNYSLQELKKSYSEE